jgi:asparagine synthetase B (glutamine-hydrolysing)
MAVMPWRACWVMETRSSSEIQQVYDPAYYYMDDEVVVVASERPVIQTVFNVPFETVHELDPGHAIITKKMVIRISKRY